MGKRGGVRRREKGREGRGRRGGEAATNALHPPPAFSKPTRPLFFFEHKQTTQPESTRSARGFTNLLAQIRHMQLPRHSPALLVALGQTKSKMAPNNELKIVENGSENGVGAKPEGPF